MPGYNVLNDELTQRVKQVVNQYMACNQLRPQPGRRRRGGGGGGADTTIAGGLAVASDDIAESNEITWGAVPQSVKDKVPEGGAIASDARCWTLAGGDGTAYQLIADTNTTQGGGIEITAVYMVPVANGDARLYNMAGAVKKDTPLQVKTLTVSLGGATQQISIIDVQKC